MSALGTGTTFLTGSSDGQFTPITLAAGQQLTFTHNFGRRAFEIRPTDAVTGAPTGCYDDLEIDQPTVDTITIYNGSAVARSIYVQVRWEVPSMDLDIIGPSDSRLAIAAGAGVVACIGGGGSGSGSAEFAAECDPATAIGDVVRWQAAGIVEPAIALTGQGHAIGVVTAKSDATHCTVMTDGLASIFVGLTAGSRYFLSDAVAGAIVTTPPSAGGSFVQEIGEALTATEMVVDVDSTVVDL